MTDARVESRLSWVADYPQHWRTRPLWSMYQRIKDINHPDEPMLSMSRDRGVVLRRDDDRAESRSIYQLVHPGWLVANRMQAWRGAVAISRMRGIVSGHYICFAPRHEENDRFLDWLFRSSLYTYGYGRLSRGVRNDQFEIDNDEYRVLPVLLPPPSEQAAIADFLDREVAQIESLIEEQRRLVDLLRERRSVTLAEAVRSDGMSMTRLKHVAAVQTGVTLGGDGDPSDPEWPYLRVANVQVGFVDTSEVKTLRVPEEVAASSLLCRGDVLMTEGGDLHKLGRGAIWDGKIGRMLHQNHIFAVRPTSVLDPEFLVYWLDGPLSRDYFRSTARKTTNLATTNKWTLGNLPVPDISLVQQRQIVAHLDSQTRAIDALIKESQRLAELSLERRTALITAAVTGQIDLREAVA